MWASSFLDSEIRKNLSVDTERFDINNLDLGFRHL